MKTAFATLDNRIAPVFDVIGLVQVVETEGERIVRETSETIAENDPLGKAACLAGLGVDAMVCGAISRSLQAMIAARGILVVPFVAGNLDPVKKAWIRGDRNLDRFAMPGCRKKGRRAFLNLKPLNQEEQAMNQPFEGSSGASGRPGRSGQRGGRQRSGLGSGQGKSGQGSGQKGGARARGTSGECQCPGCGYKAPHLRGTPCVDVTCPQCGQPMTRM